MTTPLPRIALAALGGTISMTPQTSGGIDSTVGAEQMSEEVPGLSHIARITPRTIARAASGSIRFQHLFEVLHWAKEQVANGAAGVVLTQGTDTLEETSYFLHLYWDLEAPFVVLGAMRHAEQPGADGPANLLAGVTLAARPESRGRGVMVVMNDTIHSPAIMRKTHTVSLETFVSPVAGPLGVILEGEPVFFHEAKRPFVRLFEQAPYRPNFALPFIEHVEHPLPTVMLLELGVETAPELFDFAASHCQGIVLAGVGSGHVPENWRDRVIDAAKRMPIIMCSRTGSGSTTKAYYGYIGSEVDLQRGGVLMGGWLCPRKARLLLSALLAQGIRDPQEVAAFLPKV